ncbi:helix-turn-helix transcriptional regulator [Zobellella sp. DQSA1]|uniref:AraC family transcriptional regulator n=1 Tax=Zobellella sp. DQSA1 TaxID=3342386 RepID=UPI0035C0A50A
MAWLNADDDFNPERIGQPVVGVAAEMGRHDSGVHRHDMGQLLFAQGGCIAITLADRLCMLPPTRLAWIPPRTWHRAEMRAAVDYRSVYLDAALCQGLSAEVEVLEVAPLLREILERMALADFDCDWRRGPAIHWLAVCLDELHVARREPTLLPLPADSRLRCLNLHELPPPLGALAVRVGASEKTISRIFRRDTGLSYQQWRQQWRLLKAIELLASRARTSVVASALDFASDSAFVAFFRQMTGVSPRVYMKVPRQSRDLNESF